jgi:L-lactate dehydrogenase complex protein LldG
MSEVLPAVGPDVPAMLASFARQCEKLRTRLIRVDDLAGAQQAMRGLAAEQQWRRVATHAGAGCVPASVEVLEVSGGYDRWELEKCDAGVTSCVCLVAQTGSVVVTAAHTGGRALSVLPPHHVVVARLEQLVGDMPAAYGALHEELARRPSSFASLITGPSRTGDIERILVLGAHGPKQLTIVLIGQEG